MSPSVFLFSAMAFVGGMLVAAQGPIYARLSEGLGRDHLLAVFLAFATATFATGISALATGSFRTLSVPTLAQLPYWVWLGGLFGAVHVLISMQSIPVLGVTMFLTIVVAGNMVGAAAYDHIGAMGLAERPITAWKVFGLVLVVLGVGIVARS